MKTCNWAVFLLVAIFAIGMARAEETERAHNEAGNIGPNGVKQRVAIRINKTKSGADMASFLLDLGDHRYDSVKSATLIEQRPAVLITIGSMPTMQGLANNKGRIDTPFKAKLVNRGAGIKIDMRKSTLSALLSNLSGKGDHAFLTITIQDNHAPSGTAAQQAEPRHAHSLFSKEFEVDIKENEKVLIAKG